MQTNLDVADNSGARAYNASRAGRIQTQDCNGRDVIIVSVKEAIPRGRSRRATCTGRSSCAHGKEIRAPMACDPI